ncbi:UPAR/Ly6 domain-containing protein cold-like [Tubulanus polymorphus]|uniref:UPAR/Ly6 domain-containing protein cold-like n=1 Tax=Tubulanus polymorphus TaxID=672921 RepID=UPI003DA2061E
MDKWIYLWVILASVSLSVGLECYVCDSQDSNKDKCVKSTIQCEEHHDTCATIIKYRVPPYWTERGDFRLAYITKECSTRPACEADKAVYLKACKRDWYDDWTCVECCQGDYCNYYVTLGSGITSYSIVLLVTACIGALLILRYS